MQMTSTDPIVNQWVKFLNMKTSNVTTKAFVRAAGRAPQKERGSGTSLSKAEGPEER